MASSSVMFVAVHLVIEDRVDDGPQVELELVEPQRQVAVAVALIEHHLLGVDGPAFGEDAGVEDLADQATGSDCAYSSCT